MFEGLKTVRWEWRDRIGRFNLLNGLWRNLPGGLGFAVRGRRIPRYFAEAGENIRIHEGVRFRGIHRIRCGSDVEIGVDNFLQASGGLVIGDRVMTGPGVRIWTVNHRFDDPSVPIADQGYDYEPVIIGDDCWLGAGVFVMPGVELPAGCIVSAHSVVGKKRYPPGVILSGHPARVVGRRETEAPKAATEGAH